MRGRIRERAWLVGVALLAAAIVIGSFAVGTGIRDRGQTHNDTITVTGSAKELIQSDYVIWDASVSSQQATPGAATTQLEDWMSRVRRFLASQGVKSSELSVQPFTAQAVDKTDSNGNSTVVGYAVTANLEIRSTRVETITAIAARSPQLLEDEIPFESQPLQYIYVKLAAIRLPLLAAATKDALARARVLVDASGDHLGALRTVNEGVFQVTSPDSTAVSGYGEYDTTTIPKDVSAVVTITFELS